MDAKEGKRQCACCFRWKGPTRYTPKDNPVCCNCDDKALIGRVKKHKCLRCDNWVISKQGYRLCEYCKSRDEWKEGPAEY